MCHHALFIVDVLILIISYPYIWLPWLILHECGSMLHIAGRNFPFIITSLHLPVHSWPIYPASYFICFIICLIMGHLHSSLTLLSCMQHSCGACMLSSSSISFSASVIKRLCCLPYFRKERHLLRVCRCNSCLHELSEYSSAVAAKARTKARKAIAMMSFIVEYIISWDNLLVPWWNVLCA